MDDLVTPLFRLACLTLAGPHAKTPGDQKEIAEGMMDWVFETGGIDFMPDKELRDAAMMAFSLNKDSRKG